MVAKDALGRNVSSLQEEGAAFRRQEGERGRRGGEASPRWGLTHAHSQPCPVRLSSCTEARIGPEGRA